MRQSPVWSYLVKNFTRELNDPSVAKYDQGVLIAFIVDLERSVKPPQSSNVLSTAPMRAQIALTRSRFLKKSSHRLLSKRRMFSRFWPIRWILSAFELSLDSEFTQLGTLWNSFRYNLTTVSNQPTVPAALFRLASTYPINTLKTKKPRSCTSLCRKHEWGGSILARERDVHLHMRVCKESALPFRGRNDNAPQILGFRTNHSMHVLYQAWSFTFYNFCQRNLNCASNQTWRVGWQTCCWIAQDRTFWSWRKRTDDLDWVPVQSTIVTTNLTAFLPLVFYISYVYVATRFTQMCVVQQCWKLS